METQRHSGPTWSPNRPRKDGTHTQHGRLREKLALPDPCAPQAWMEPRDRDSAEKGSGAGRDAGETSQVFRVVTRHLGPALKTRIPVANEGPVEARRDPC